MLKRDLKRLHKKVYVGIETKYYGATERLQQMKEGIHKNPSDMVLRQDEDDLLKEFQQIRTAYFSYLQQRAKMNELVTNDNTSDFFL